MIAMSWFLVLVAFVLSLAVPATAEKAEKCFNHEEDEDVKAACEACKDETTENNKKFFCELAHMKVLVPEGDSMTFDVQRAKVLIERMGVEEKKEEIHNAVETCKSHENNGQEYCHCIHEELKGECEEIKLTKDDPES